MTPGEGPPLNVPPPNIPPPNIPPPTIPTPANTPAPEVAALTQQLDQVNSQNFHERLGISEGANPEQIKEAIRNKRNPSHPDRYPGEAPEIQEIRNRIFQAYDEAGQAIAGSQTSQPSPETPPYPQATMETFKRQAAEDIATVVLGIAPSRSMIERVKKHWIDRKIVTKTEADEIERAAWRREGGRHLLDL